MFEHNVADDKLIYAELCCFPNVTSCTLLFRFDYVSYWLL